MTTNNTETLIEEEEEEPRKSLHIFGRNVAEIPCFRSTFLYGISLGLFVGFATFMKTSRPKFSSDMGMATFIGTTLCYWFPCRYRHSQQQFEVRKIQALMRNATMFEGTALEEEVSKKSESV